MIFRRLFMGMAAFVIAVGPAGGARPAAPPDAFPAVFAGLRDQHDRRFDPVSVAGRFALVNFVFTRCGTTCPIQMQQLSRFERSLPAAVRAKLVLISVSVDPANDTPAEMRRYAEAFSADGRRWQFLTGDMAGILRVTQAFTAFRPDRTDAAFHTSDIRLFDPRGRMIQRYAGAPLASAQLRADLLALAAKPAA